MEYQSWLNTNLESLSSLKIYGNGYWKEAIGFHVFHYEGSDIEKYDIPYPHVFVLVMQIMFNWTNADGSIVVDKRGVAFAYQWNITDSVSWRIWMNNIQSYGEKGAYDWEGWNQIH